VDDSFIDAEYPFVDINTESWSELIKLKGANDKRR
jgi:hypothetical protein